MLRFDAPGPSRQAMSSSKQNSPGVVRGNWPSSTETTPPAEPATTQQVDVSGQIARPRPPARRKVRTAPLDPGSLQGRLLSWFLVAVLVGSSLIALANIDGGHQRAGAPTMPTVPTATTPTPAGEVPSGEVPTTVDEPVPASTPGAAPSGRPVMHQPRCKVTVALAPTAGTPERRALVDAALTTLTSAGGFDFSPGGTSNADITIGWEEIAEPDVLGVTTTRSRDDEITRAYVIVEPGLGDKEPAVVMHELIHALGAGHSDSAGDLMYPALMPGRTADLSVGDLDVVAHLGRLAGCRT